jgi:hypothetical protein
MKPLRLYFLNILPGFLPAMPNPRKPIFHKALQNLRTGYCLRTSRLTVNI